jgi:hypothetical protein
MKLPKKEMKNILNTFKKKVIKDLLCPQRLRMDL